MKFLRKYFKSIIQECIRETDRPPIIIEIVGEKKDEPLQVNIEGCYFVASSTHAALALKQRDSKGTSE